MPMDSSVCEPLRFVVLNGAYPEYTKMVGVLCSVLAVCSASIEPLPVHWH